MEQTGSVTEEEEPAVTEAAQDAPEAPEAGQAVTPEPEEAPEAGAAEEESAAGAAAAKRKKRIRIFLICLCSLLVLAAAAAAGVWVYAQRVWNSQQQPESSFAQEEVHTNPDIPEETRKVFLSGEYTLIMFYGVDARNNEDILKNANADTDILCCINNETREVRLVSILRDTFLETTKGKHRKLTDIYSQYGVQESLGTINQCLDLNVTKYVTVNWKAVADVVDALGGLDIEMKKSEVNALDRYLWDVEEATGLTANFLFNEGAGTYHLDGVQTVAYARIRNVGHHDITRSERHRTVIAKILEKAKDADIGTLADICEMVFPSISTNFSFSQTLDIMSEINDFTIVDTTVFPFEYRDQTQLSTAYVYPKNLDNNVSDLHAYLFGEEEYEPSDTVKEISDYIKQYRKSHP